MEKQNSKFTSIILTVIFVAVTIYIVSLQRNLAKLQGEKVEVLKGEKADLLKDVDSLKKAYKALELKKPKIIKEIIEVEKKLKNKQNETNSVPAIIGNYADSKLDSTIRAHKHKQRE